MSDKQQLDRTKLTFSQAEGLESLPAPLKLGELSPELRNHLWHLIYSQIDTSKTSTLGVPYFYLRDPWSSILYDNHVFMDHKAADEWSNRYEANTKSVKEIMLRKPYNKVFDFLQFVLRHPQCPRDLLRMVQRTLANCNAAYTVIKDGPTIVPAATPEEASAVQVAFETLSAAGFDGARAHFRYAAKSVNASDYAGCVRESIHAVESVARLLDSNASTSLSPALKALEDRIRLHPALVRAFDKMYGYSCDEQGVRHAILDDQVEVDQTDAVFMLGACASFVTYLVSKARESGLISR